MKKIFKEAHKMTREMIKEYKVDYQVQFGLNLSYLLENKEEKEMIKTIADLENKIKVETKRGEAKINLNLWNNYGKSRLYIEIRLVNAGKNLKYFLDLKNEDTLYSQNGQHTQRYMEEVLTIVTNILKENKELIKELAGITKKKVEVVEEVKSEELTEEENYRELDRMAHTMSAEDFEDITGRSVDHFRNVR